MLCLCLQVGDEDSREQLIKTHYMARVGELTTQLQISDSKAVHFHSEVKLSHHCLSQEVLLSIVSNMACHLGRDMETLNAEQSLDLFSLVFLPIIIPQLFLSASLICLRTESVETEPELNLVSLFFPLCTLEMVLESHYNQAWPFLLRE